MIHFIFFDKKEDVYCNYNAETKIYAEFKTLAEIGLQKIDYVLTYNQSFLLTNTHLDIVVIEKILYFNGSKNFNNLHQKYLHKAFEGKSNKQFAEAAIKVFQKQRAIIKDNKLDAQINFEGSLAGTIKFINKGVIKIKQSFIEEVENIDGAYKDKILTHKDLVSYCTDKRYNIYNLNSGKFNLTHERLLTFKDDLINKHVEAEKARASVLHKNQYAHSEIQINHNQWGAVTGRITTSTPNLQGMDKKIIEGNIHSFDYVAFETMIYMETYKPPVYKKFLDSKKKDIYGFMYEQVMPPLVYDSDELKSRDPGKRSVFKKTLLAIIFGATWTDLEYINNIDWKGFKAMHENIVDMLDLKKVNQNLMAYLVKTGRFYIGSEHYCSVGTKESYQYSKLLPAASNHFGLVEKIKDIDFFNVPKDLTEYREFFTKERGLVDEVMELKASIIKNLVSYQIQGLGAMIIKVAAKYIVAAARQSKLLVLVHDEAVLELLDVTQSDIVIKAMKDAYSNITGGVINVEMKKI